MLPIPLQTLVFLISVHFKTITQTIDLKHDVCFEKHPISDGSNAILLSITLFHIEIDD